VLGSVPQPPSGYKPRNLDWSTHQIAMAAYVAEVELDTRGEPTDEYRQAT